VAEWAGRGFVVSIIVTPRSRLIAFILGDISRLAQRIHYAGLASLFEALAVRNTKKYPVAIIAAIIKMHPRGL
jgi:hypothetical protein